MSHTPGKWTAYPAIIKSSEGDFAVIAKKPDSEETSTDNWESNSALMAAAPEMLEALEGIKINLEIHQHEHRWAHSLLKDVETAIKKVRGES